MECEKIFANHLSGKGLIPEMYKEFVQFKANKTKQK